MMTANDFGNQISHMLMNDDAHRLKREREAAAAPAVPKAVDPDYKSWHHHVHNLECRFNWHARTGADVMIIVKYQERDGRNLFGHNVEIALHHDQGMTDELRELFHRDDAHISRILDLKKPFDQAHGELYQIPVSIEKALRQATFDRILPTLGFRERMHLRLPARREAYKNALNIYHTPMPVYDPWFL